MSFTYNKKRRTLCQTHMLTIIYIIMHIFPANSRRINRPMGYQSWKSRNVSILQPTDKKVFPYKVPYMNYKEIAPIYIYIYIEANPEGGVLPLPPL